MIEKNGRLYETPEDNLFHNEVNGIRLRRSFVKQTGEKEITFEDILSNYITTIINKELG